MAREYTDRDFEKYVSTFLLRFCVPVMSLCLLVLVVLKEDYKRVVNLVCHYF